MTPLATALYTAAPFLFILLGLVLTVLTDSYISRVHKRIMLTIVTLAATLIAQNIADFLLDGTPYRLARIICGIYGYSVRPLIIVLFYYFVTSGKKILPAWCLVWLNAALYLTALFSPITFTYGAENFAFLRGPLGYACHFVGAALLLWLFVLVIYRYRKSFKEMLFPVSGILFITAGVLTDYLLPTEKLSALSALTVSVVITCVFIYFWLHIQFVHQHESDLKAEQRIRIMMSQIQPHFLFNTIATFRALCKRDSDLAAEVAEKFGQYLRQNLDALDTEGLIPVEQEIEHTRIYADIEMVRFENVRVEYQIGDRDFYLPPLSIQPIVENAIRHGVRIRKEGIVRVITRRTYHDHEIVISDSGVGLEPGGLAVMGGSHIGLSNVRERIEKLCGGTLTLESKPDVGTTVTIRIPAEGASA